ncbi:Cys-tRNA(Pro) deacylase [Spiractinospora alimapuensis]|uniref:Cys-tRNA(Pro) deacylase n=1 Tax=Spiractinospora alimapuensis TaxID=2820884 RepID=UPI001EEB4A8A|nr:Cys-tRNA(Pro) deacylase [Spiractinospora alimapuensis]QVQ53015.1 Cys-tRNA(Pro) deacylase [Spiractinospora alimapuensis]
MARTAKGRGAGSTPAVTVVTRAGIDFVLHGYEAETEGAASYGERAAAELGVAPERVFKTLVAEVDGVLTVAVVPVSGSLDLKALARAVGGKRAVMADPLAAERATGYVTGGISPLGQRKRLPTLVDRTVTDHDTVYVSAGRRGAQLELSPDDLLALCAGATASIAASRG